MGRLNEYRPSSPRRRLRAHNDGSFARNRLTAAQLMTCDCRPWSIDSPVWTQLKWFHDSGYLCRSSGETSVSGSLPYVSARPQTLHVTPLVVAVGHHLRYCHLDSSTAQFSSAQTIVCDTTSAVKIEATVEYCCHVWRMAASFTSRTYSAIAGWAVPKSLTTRITNAAYQFKVSYSFCTAIPITQAGRAATGFRSTPHF